MDFGYDTGGSLGGEQQELGRNNSPTTVGADVKDKEDDVGSGLEVLHAMGSLKKAAPGRCSSVRYDAEGRMVAVLSIGKALEVFR